MPPEASILSSVTRGGVQSCKVHVKGSVQFSTAAAAAVGELGLVRALAAVAWASVAGFGLPFVACIP